MSFNKEVSNILNNVDIYYNNIHMTALTERWGYNEPEITSEEIEQVHWYIIKRADFLMTHGSVPIKLVHLIVEGKTYIHIYSVK